MKRFYYIGRRFYTKEFLLANWKNHDIESIIANCSWVVDYSEEDIKRITSENPDYLKY